MVVFVVPVIATREFSTITESAWADVMFACDGSDETDVILSHKLELLRLTPFVAS